jgi:hypothetical protein
MKKIIEKRNVKAMIPLPVKGDKKKEFVLKNPPNVRPLKDKHGK